MKLRSRKLQVEALESRVMLAAVDVPITTLSAENVLSSAVRSDGAVVDVSFPAVDKTVMLRGSGIGSITIDLDFLPASVISIQISSFESVTLVGNHSVDNLVLSNIAHVSAGKIQINDGNSGTNEFITGLYAFNVQHIQIDQTPSVVMLQGKGFGQVGDRTLLDVGKFSPGVIVSYLDNLGLSSANGIKELNIISGSQRQAILLNFQPDRLNISGIDSSIQQVSLIKGDFTRYFLASSAERLSLEQSLLIARQAAIANVVSLASLLSNPQIQAAVSEVSESVSNLGKAKPRTMIDSESFASKLVNGGSMVDMVRANPEESAAKHVSNSGFGGFEAVQGEFARLPIRSESAESTADVSAHDFLFAADDLPNPNITPSQDLATVAASAALGRFAEPFEQMVSELRGRFATFGDMVTARVTEHLRVESRPALLVDARTSRSREDRDFQLITY